MFRNIIVIFVVIQSTSFSCSANYLYAELNQSRFNNSSLHFSIFIHDFIGILFYGFQSMEDRLLIELEEENEEKIIDFKTKYISIRRKSKELCGCSICEDIYLRVTLELNQGTIKTECNGKRRLIRMDLSSKSIVKNKFGKYPIPRQYKSVSNTVFIWMGNIGYYIGYSYLVTYAVKNQLKGCLDKFYFNRSPVLFQFKDGSSLLPNCSKNYIETICTRNNCSNKSRLNDVSGCSWSTVDGGYCRNVAQIIYADSSSYLYTELNGGLFHTVPLNFSIFIRDFIGILFYCFESLDNRLLIEIEEENGEKIIDFKTKYVSIRQNSKYLCGCFNCDNIYLRVILELKRDEILTECNGERRKTKMNISTVLTTANSFNGYPIPKQYKNFSNKLFIWMGNIGHYIGHTSFIYKPLKNQLKGCLDKFYFNRSPVLFQSKDGSSLLPNCPTEYIETICTRNNCSKTLISTDVSDCSLATLNGRYCRNGKSLSILKKGENVYKVNGRQKEVMFQLKWKPMEDKNYCLMEIESSNGSRMIIYINDQNVVSIKAIVNRSTLYSQELASIYSKDVNILSMRFNERDFIVKLYSEDEIRGYGDKLIGSPTLMRIGEIQDQSVCTKYEGTIYFQFYLSQIKFKLKNPEEKGNTFLFIVFVIATGIVSAILFLLIKICYVLKTDTKFKTSDQSLEDIYNIPISNLISASKGKTEENETEDVNVYSVYSNRNEYAKVSDLPNV